MMYKIYNQDTTAWRPRQDKEHFNHSILNVENENYLEKCVHDIFKQFNKQIDM